MIQLDLELPLGSRSLRARAELPDGVTVLMGPSGAGKTSLLEAIAGLRPRARGRIAVGEHVLLDTAAGVRLPPEARRVGYVPQDAGLFPHLDVARNVAFGARDPGAVDSAVRALEIEPLLSRVSGSLSGGEKQRVALARALAAAPRLLLLDEPLAALDLALRERIIPYLLRIRAEWGVPALYVTHNVGEAVVLGGHLLTLEDGRITAQGAPLEMLATPAVTREAAWGLENLLSGRVVAHDEAGGVTRVQIDAGPPVTVTLTAELRLGARILLAIRAEDVLVASQPVSHLSARNVYEARLTSVEETGPDVTLRCTLAAGGSPWLVRLTRAAVRELSLVEGASVWLAVKSHSVRLV